VHPAWFSCLRQECELSFAATALFLSPRVLQWFGYSGLRKFAEIESLDSSMDLGVRIWSSNPGPDLNMLWLALPKTLPIVCFSLVTLARLL